MRSNALLQAVCRSWRPMVRRFLSAAPKQLRASTGPQRTVRMRGLAPSIVMAQRRKSFLYASMQTLSKRMMRSRSSMSSAVRQAQSGCAHSRSRAIMIRGNHRSSRVFRQELCGPRVFRWRVMYNRMCRTPPRSSDSFPTGRSNHLMCSFVECFSRPISRRSTSKARSRSMLLTL